MKKFIKELYKEDFPFLTLEKKKIAFTNFLYEMRNNKIDVLTNIADQQGRKAEEYKLINTGWYEYKGEQVHLLNYQYNDYSSELWNSEGEHWKYKAGIYSDMKSLRTEVLDLIENIRFTLWSKTRVQLNDLLEVLENSKIKNKLSAILEVEEIKRKFSHSKRYPLGSLHGYLFLFLDIIADQETNKSNEIFKMVEEIGLNKIYYAEKFNPIAMNEDDLEDFILNNSLDIKFLKAGDLKEKYKEIICKHEDQVKDYKEKLFQELSKILKGKNEMTDDGWCKLNDFFHYKKDYSFVRFKGAVCKIKPKSKEPLEALVKQYRHQEEAEILLTKEKLINLSKYEPNNIKEFRISKSMFPQEPMRSLVVYDKSLDGYKLAV